MSIPEVSIVIPCLNEEKTILSLLDSILQQTYPTEKLEVIISDGMSEDKTRQLITDFQSKHDQLKIRLVDNPVRRIPTGLNLAIKAADGSIIIRMDAHAIPMPDYVERSVGALKQGQGDNVGGVIIVKPGADTWIGRSISVATAHPLGVGDAKYRWATQAGEADTVAFGTLYRSKIEALGFFNEDLKANEDYEFNSRLRASGGKVWIDPQIKAVYFSRPTLSSLARQYFWYGFWKVKMLKLFPKTLRWRQALPPIFVFGVLMLLLLAGFVHLARLLLAFGFGSYLLILVAASIKIAVSKNDFRLVIGIPLAIMTMHFCWGAGFWWSLINLGKKA